MKISPFETFLRRNRPSKVNIHIEDVVLQFDVLTDNPVLELPGKAFVKRENDKNEYVGNYDEEKTFRAQRIYTRIDREEPDRKVEIMLEKTMISRLQLCTVQLYKPRVKDLINTEMFISSIQGEDGNECILPSEKLAPLYKGITKASVILTVAFANPSSAAIFEDLCNKYHWLPGTNDNELPFFKVSAQNNQVTLQLTLGMDQWNLINVHSLHDLAKIAINRKRLAYLWRDKRFITFGFYQWEKLVENLADVLYLKHHNAPGDDKNSELAQQQDPDKQRRFYQEVLESAEKWKVTHGDTLDSACRFWEAVLGKYPNISAQWRENNTVDIIKVLWDAHKNRQVIKPKDPKLREEHCSTTEAVFE